MAKRKNNQKKKKQQQVVAVRSVSRYTPSRAHVEQVCGLTDPFCPAAQVAKMPDNAGIRSLVFPFHTRGVLTSDIAGFGAILFASGYDYRSAPGTVSVSGGDIISAYSAFDAASISFTGVSGYRLVSAGLVIRNITAPLNASGTVHIRGFAPQLGAALTSVSLLKYNCDFSYDVALQDCKDLCVMLKKTDPRANLFFDPAQVNPTADVTDWVSNGWGPLQIGVTGVPASTTVLDYEVFYNFELTFGDGSTNQLLATPSPKANPVIKEAAEWVSSEAKQVFRGGMKAVSRWAISAAAAALGRKMGLPVSTRALALTNYAEVD
jgi:hypothetical protein